MASPLARTLLVLACLLAGRQDGWAANRSAEASCPATTTLPFQVRIVDCHLRQALFSGIARSSTLQRLIARVGDLKGIVYVDARCVFRPETRRVFYGTLQHRIVKAGNYRLLYVTVAAESGDRPVVTLAHELQHAIEVLESDAATDSDIERLFDRIGSHASAWAFETQAALEAQRAVAKELSAGR